MQKCDYCGHLNEDSAKHCLKCGTELESFVKQRQEAEGLSESFGTSEFVCTECHVAFSVQRKPARTTLGFVKVYCPSCSKEILYPLTSGYRIFYWIFGIVLILGAGKMVFGEGSFTPGMLIPGVLYSAMLVALIIDAKHRNRVRNAWKKRRTATADKPTA